MHSRLGAIYFWLYESCKSHRYRHVNKDLYSRFPRGYRKDATECCRCILSSLSGKEAGIGVNTFTISVTITLSTVRLCTNTIDLQILRKNNLIHHNCHKLDDAKRVPNSTTRLSFYDSTTSLLPPPFEHNASFLLVASVVRGCFVLKAAPQSITDAKLGVSCPDFQCICVAKE